MSVLGASSLQWTASTEVLSKVKKNVAMWVGYVGTDYRGLQIQRGVEGIQCVENELEEAIYKAGGITDSNYKHFGKLKWRRSSRTDKGVHSLSTVITMKMEVPLRAWQNDADGVEIAESLNTYLPPALQILGVVPVTKSFSARRACSSRSYEYFIPAELIGIGTEGTSSSRETEVKLQAFRCSLKHFEGKHAFHNYTIRKLYRHQRVAMPEKEDEIVQEEPVDEGDGAHHRAYWENGSDDAVEMSHYRSITQCTCGELEIFGDIPVVRVKVTGRSFMIHQIRKMVGTAIAVARNVLPEDVIPMSMCKYVRVVLPIAPSEGLVLSGNSFLPLQGSYMDNRKHSFTISISEQVSARKESFWLQRLRPVITESMDTSRPVWVSWLESLDLNHTGEAELGPVREYWKNWQQAATKSQ